MSSLIEHLLLNGLEKRLQKKDLERRNMTCMFSGSLSAERFEKIVYLASKNITRLEKVVVEGPVIYGTVLSQSGSSHWNFILDFNNYGNVTGKYWIESSNEDSNIPKYLANNIQYLIMHNDQIIETPRKRKKVDITNIECPMCGDILNYQYGFESWKVASYCYKCGTYCEWASGFMKPPYKSTLSFPKETMDYVDEEENVIKNNTSESIYVPLFESTKYILVFILFIIILFLL